MRNKGIQLQAGLLLAIFTMTVLSSGCEPLRKKFTRKKKEDTSDKEFIPVLDPVDYPDKVETPTGAYKLHYSLWQGWYQDYLIASQANGSDKKMLYNLNQMLLHGQEMQNVLQGEKQKEMEGVVKKVAEVIAQYKTPRGVRNDSVLRQQVIAIDKELRQNLKFQTVKDSLVPSL